MAERGRARLGELEREVMERLWAEGSPMTVRAVYEDIAASRPIAYTTVMTVLQRLARKSMVEEIRDGRAFHYAPARTRESITADLMHDALDQLDDSDDRAAALVRFVSNVSAAEAAALRDALAAVESGQRSSS